MKSVPVVAALLMSVFILAGAASLPRIQAPSGWELVVLGIAQDAGIPQLGCEQELCRSIRAGKRKPERVSSLGLVNRSTGRSYLFDATPDLVSQLATLNGGKPPDGVFLTHGHIGHYTGLMYFGRESLDAKEVPVYGTERMAAYLRGNGPWSQLVTRNNISLKVVTSGTGDKSGAAMSIEPGLSVTAFTVPHRDEFTDTVGYRIERGDRRAVFIPDIDQWSRWSRSIREIVDGVDVAFLDGTFASADELPGRTIADIPHPLIPATRELLKGSRAQVWFIHLNHTNSQLGAKDVARDGMVIPF